MRANQDELMSIQKIIIERVCIGREMRRAFRIWKMDKYYREEISEGAA